VQAAREAARRVSCLNNVVQLNLAVHNFEFHFEHLPSGVINPDGPIRSEPQGKHVSWIVQVLPYMEQQQLAKRFDQAAGAYAEKNAQVRNAQISMLLCPSDPHNDPTEDNKVARSGYAGCYHDAEAPIDKDNHGLLFLNSKVRYPEIEDGSAATLLVGEALTFPDRLGWVSGTRATLRNTSVIEQPRPTLGGSQAGGADEDDKKLGATFVGGFGSYHPGGVNAGFADGSAQYLSLNTDATVLHQIGNRADGEIVKPF
jgi:prepilin-type processing-associated H-X9-DG protein